MSLPTFLRCVAASCVVLVAASCPARAQSLSLPATAPDTMTVGTSAIVRPVVRDAIGRPTSVSRVVAISFDTSIVATSYVSGGQRLTARRAGTVGITWWWDRTDGRRLAVYQAVEVIDSAAPAPPPPPPPPPPPASTTLVDSIRALMGPMLSVSAMRAKGGAFRQYEDRFRFWADSQWVMYGADHLLANYYDRAAIYYVWWARGSGVASDTTRARLLAVNYRTWLEHITSPRPYATAPRNAQLEGLMLDWMVRGDSASRTAVLRTAEELWLTTQSVFQYIDTTGGRTAWEPRIQARILLAQWLAERLAPNAPKWGQRVDALLPRILSTQSADGAWRPASACGESLNYMSAMLLDVLARVYNAGRPDATLAAAIERGVTWLWDNEWLSSAGAFRYMPINCAGVGGPNAAPDVAGLMAAPVTWMAARHGGVWTARADSALAATTRAYLYGSKQFNETYNGSYRYWR